MAHVDQHYIFVTNYDFLDAFQVPRTMLVNDTEPVRKHAVTRTDAVIWFMLKTAVFPFAVSVSTSMNYNFTARV